jgi:hypothetical protein
VTYVTGKHLYSKTAQNKEYFAGRAAPYVIPFGALDVIQGTISRTSSYDMTSYPASKFLQRYLKAALLKDVETI